MSRRGDLPWGAMALLGDGTSGPAGNTGFHRSQPQYRMSPVNRKPRHDPYRFIHKGLRAALFDTLQALGSADAADDADLAAALGRAEELIALLLEHMRQENHFFHVAIEARQPGGAQAAGDEHAQLRDALADLQDDVQRLRRTPAEGRGLQLHWLYQRFCAMAAEQLAHMGREEDELNALLWALYSDEELRAIHHSLLAASEPRLLRVLIAWMAAALAPRELAGLFALVRHMASPADFDALLMQAQERLGPVRWARVRPLLLDAAA